MWLNTQNPAFVAICHLQRQDTAPAAWRTLFEYLGHHPSAIQHERKTRCQGEGETLSLRPAINVQTLPLSDIHPPSSLPSLGGRSHGNAGIPDGCGAGSWVLASWGAPLAPPTLPLHAQEGKKIRRQRRKASAAKWLIGFYGNWLRSTPAAYPTVPLSPYF